MATEEPQAPEGFHNPSAYDDDETNFELEPGESMVALVLSINDFEKDWGTGWNLKLKKENNGDVGNFLAKGDLKALIRDDNLKEGDVVWIAKGVTQDSFDGNDFYPTRAKVQGGDD